MGVINIKKYTVSKIGTKNSVSFFEVIEVSKFLIYNTANYNFEEFLDRFNFIVNDTEYSVSELLKKNGDDYKKQKIKWLKKNITDDMQFISNILMFDDCNTFVYGDFSITIEDVI